MPWLTRHRLTEAVDAKGCSLTCGVLLIGAGVFLAVLGLMLSTLSLFGHYPVNYTYAIPRGAPW